MSKARGSYRVDPLGHKKKSPVLLNGLTEAETNATASVMGLVEQKVLEHAPCLGMNCGITRTDQMHSAECQAEHAATIAGGKFVKPAQPQQEPVAWLVDNGGDSILIRHSQNFPGVFVGSEFNKRPLVFGDTSPPTPAQPQPQQEPVEVPTTPYEHRKFVLVGREWYERFAAFHDDCQIGEQLTWQEKTIRQQGYENGWNDAQRYLKEPQATSPTPAQRKPLPPEWINDCVREAGGTTAPDSDFECFEWLVRKVESAHDIKENT